MTVVTEPSARLELEEAMRHHVEAIRRLPTHWIDQRARWHDKINTLLDQWETA